MNGPSRTLISRRRMLMLIAGVALTVGSTGGAIARRQAFEWQGTALGADARLVLVHEDHAAVQAALRLCLAEIERLEAIFSLYRPQSELCRLNRDGLLRYPSLDMMALLRIARAVSEASGGAFDASVQPLWQLYADHFRKHPGDPAGPPELAIERALKHVHFQRIDIDTTKIRIEPGMALTLNGIAQGYITDRVAELLRARGWPDVLIDLGEVRAIGASPLGTPWTAVIQPPAPATVAPIRLALSQHAMATSAGQATVFEASGHHHHLFSPRDGRSAGQLQSVSVLAPDATLADALSTALYVMPREEMRRLIDAFPAIEAWLVEADGRVVQLTPTVPLVASRRLHS